jgi:RNase H-fold protein (predicted Holliday junction resolvase)
MTDGPQRERWIGVDPGRVKCGIAGMFRDGSKQFVEVVPTERIRVRLAEHVAAGGVCAICVGHATTSAAVVEWCRTAWPDIPLHVIDETNSSMLARALYYEDHPPRGLLRFVPRGLLVPDEPLDGYAALIIVRRYFESDPSTTSLKTP